MKQHKAQRTIWDNTGQSLVEFALILPILLLLVLGTIDIGMGFKTYIALTNAAREGARSISIYPSEQELAEERIAQEAVRVGLVEGAFGDGGYAVNFSPTPEYEAGVPVTVNIDYNYELFFGIIPGLTEIPFTASATMVVLYDE